MKVVAGYKFLQTLAKSNISQTILVEKHGIKYVLKMATGKDYNTLIKREYFMHHYLFPEGIVPRAIAKGYSGKRYYFIREWIQGMILGDFLKDKDAETITEYFKKSLYLLHKLHTLGIILIDISPSNFFVDHKGKLFIIDMGSAILYKEKTELQGTPPYIAPESITNQRFSFKTDLYSIGALFYYFYSGNPPYQAKTLDDLLQKQQMGLPPMKRIPYRPKRLISKLMSFREELRPTALYAIKALEDSPEIEHLLVNKNFPIVFSGNLDEIVKKITVSPQKNKNSARIINVFQSHYPEGFFPYIFKELSLRLALNGYKTAENTYTPSADVLLWYSETEHELMKVLSQMRSNQKIIVFSHKPLKINHKKYSGSTLYMNIGIRKSNLEEQVKEVIGIDLLYDLEEECQNLPIYATLNVKILKSIIPERLPGDKSILQSIADHIYAESPDLIDFLASFKFAIPKDLIYTALLNRREDTPEKPGEKGYISLLIFLELLGFIEIAETHIILFPTFNIFLRRNTMQRKLLNIQKSENIYDELENILHKNATLYEIQNKIKILLQEKRLLPTHARIFLDRLYETANDTKTRVDILKTKISLGFWKSAINDWHKLTSEINPKNDLTFFIDYARLTISLGKYHEAVDMLKSVDNPRANSLLIYAHAIYSHFKEFKETIRKKRCDKENPYYHIGIGLYELAVNKNIPLAKNHAVRANELSGSNVHAAMVGKYLYGISLIEEGDMERAISMLESITGHEEYGIEALLVNFHLGYIHYRRKEFSKAFYYFEYSYYMAGELNYTPLSAQAAFYLSHMYYQNNKLDLAESYMDYAYKLHKALSHEQQKYLFKNYLKVKVSLHHFEKALEFLKNNPEVEETCDFMTLSRIYLAAGDERKLKKLKDNAKNKVQKEVINLMLKILNEERKNKEVYHE